MALGPADIGLQHVYDQLAQSYIGFEQYEQEYNNTNNISTNNSSVNTNHNSSLPIQRNNVLSSNSPSNIAKTMTYSRYASTSNGNSQFPIKRLFTPFLSSVYTEIDTIWFRKKWLIFSDNRKETFLTLRSDISDYLTVQMAIDQNCFINSKLPLLNQPECLLIRTEGNNKSLFLPNSIISFGNFFDRNKQLSQAKLIAIICESDKMKNKLMFYKHSATNHWYILNNDLINPSQSFSNILSNEEQLQLESLLKQNNHRKFIHPSELDRPLSALCYHPITYIYLVQKINDEN
ncbi:unnamed protein product [Rotaria sp. Silwood1]|nr:unnamed protein product [Rotaria sp. Silwood1]CAF0749778.1 unnamed protein product [Rotaria sp. Silwood1]CAF3329513.1 unnamed protein product [Rotaria sp. Silwood1]CAF4614874.1 unnamed protein product [Rotaria sp. Silwood1]CAF4635034.1 unnamed protein product [Rotaria sp. Silwood1]